MLKKLLFAMVLLGAVGFAASKAEAGHWRRCHGPRIHYRPAPVFYSYGYHVPPYVAYGVPHVHWRHVHRAPLLYGPGVSVRVGW